MPEKLDLSGLNRRQLEAVTAPKDGSVLAVYACAGSGKTRVITYRIAYLIKELVISPSTILACTFTNKAAGEMKQRVNALIGSEAQGLWIGTFHSICLRILRVEATHLGFSTKFTVMDEEDTQDLVKSCMKDLHIDPKQTSPSSVRSSISFAKSALIGPEEYAATAVIPKTRAIASVYNLYEQRLKEMNAMDFDDLIGNTILLFERLPQVAKKYREKFQYVLVDEYQDINRSQHKLVKLLSSTDSIMVVGDDDQSIYTFRGASPNIMLEFEHNFPGSKLINLEENYRSTKNIISVASRLVENNINRHKKNIVSVLGEGEQIAVFAGMEPSDEAMYVAARIKEKISKGRKFSDFAVLYRTNAQSRSFEDSFMALGIPYQLIGGIRFYQRKEIKDLLAYLKCSLNLSDSMSFKRAISVPRRGIGPQFLAKLEFYAKTLQTTHESSLRHMLQTGEIGDSTARGVKSFLNVLDSLRELANTSPAHEVIKYLIEELKIVEELREEGTEESVSRAENVEEFLNLAYEFTKLSEDQGIDSFLGQVALLTDIDTVQEGADKVTMTTVHQAKGLEFPIVFLCGLEEGTFPHARSLDTADGVEEERRLAYVGITRAKEMLHLCRVVNRQLYGGLRSTEASRFLKEIQGVELKFEGVGAKAGGLERQFVKKMTIEPPKPKKEPLFVEIGEEVIHGAWGEGQVLSKNGEDAEVDFKSVGKKLLNLRYAPIKRKDS